MNNFTIQQEQNLQNRTSRTMFWTGERWSQHKSAAKIYPTEESASSVAKGFYKAGLYVAVFDGEDSCVRSRWVDA